MHIGKDYTYTLANYRYDDISSMGILLLTWSLFTIFLSTCSLCQAFEPPASRDFFSHAHILGRAMLPIGNQIASPLPVSFSLWVFLLCPFIYSPWLVGCMLGLRKNMQGDARTSRQIINPPNKLKNPQSPRFPSTPGPSHSSPATHKETGLRTTKYPQSPLPGARLRLGWSGSLMVRGLSLSSSVSSSVVVDEEVQNVHVGGLVKQPL